MEDEKYEIERLRREKESRKRSFEGSIFSLKSFVEYCRKYEEGHFFDPGTFRFWKMRLCYGKGIKKTPTDVDFDLDNEWWKTEEGKKYRETCLPNV